MKFDKRFVLAAALLTGLGFSTFACSDDDDDKGKKEETKCELTADSCTADQTWNAKDCKCNPKQASTCEKAESDCTDGKKLDKDKCECVEDKGGEECTKAESDCTDGKKLDKDKCECVEDKGGDECTLECSADDHKKLDSDKCECLCETGYKAGESADAACVVDEAAGECKLKESDCSKYEEFDADNCRCNTKSSETCNDGVLDADELCDNKDNDLKKVDADFTCKAWFEANKSQLGEGVQLVEDDEAAAPSCGKTCMSLGQGTCKTTESVLCGNGKIDEGEVCDIGVDNQKNTDDDVIKDDVTCKDYQDSNWKEGGKPGCASDCKGYAVGSCKAEGEPEADTCKASIAYDDATHKATATVEASNAEAKTTVICAPKSSKLDALVATNVELTASNEFDASSLTDSGDYACYVVYIDKDNKRSFCSADGAIVSLSDATVENVGLASFTVASSVSADVIAKWTFAGYNTKKDDPKNIVTLLPAGIAPDEGSDKDLKLKWEAVGENGNAIAIKLTADNSGVSGSLTALQLTTSGATGKYGDSQKAAEASHLSIADLSAYTVSSVSMTVKYEGAKIYVTEVTDTEEKVVSTLDGSASYASVEAKGFTAKAKNINVYFDNASVKAPSIDDITVVGTK